jgi:predicted PurR-regulated permease PerM
LLKFITRRLLIIKIKGIIKSMESPRKVTVEVTNKTVVRTIIWIVATVILFKFMGYISHVLTLIFAAFFLALALNPVVSWSRRRLKIKSRAQATAVAYLIIVLFLIIFFALVTPPLVRQTREFITNIPQNVQQFQSQDTGLSRAVQRYNLDKKLDQGSKDFASNYSNYGSKLLDTGKRVAEAIASVFAVLVMTFMMLVEGPKWFELYFNSLPERKRLRQKKIASKMYKAVTGYVNGQVIIAAVAGTFAFLTLEIAGQILDVPSNAVALGGIVFVFGIIPLFGNPIAAVLVVLVSLLNSVTLAIIMAIYFVIYFFIENHTFQPYVQSRLNDLTPLMVFIAALIGVSFGGILGAIVAIPAASAVKILAEDYYERRNNHKPTIDKEAI